MAKSLRSNKKKALRSLKRQTVEQEPVYVRMEQRTQDALDRAMNAAPLPVAPSEPVNNLPRARGVKVKNRRRREGIVDLVRQGQAGHDEMMVDTDPTAIGIKKTKTKKKAARVVSKLISITKANMKKRGRGSKIEMSTEGYIYD